MGRPKDEFVWQHVVEGAEKDARKCKHCGKEFRKASATRMINHLAGLGNDISACAAVHPTVKEEAAKRILGSKGKRIRKGRISSVQEQTAIDNPTVGAAGPSNIQFNTTQATVAAVEPALTDTTDVCVIRVLEECDPHFLPSPDPVDATGEEPVVTDMNTNHVREDGEMMRLLTATDSSLGLAPDAPFFSDSINRVAATPFFQENASNAEEPAVSRMDANMRVEMLRITTASDNSLGIADEINRVTAIPLFSEDIFNGGDRRAGASSNSFNQHMSNLLPTLSLSSINNLITPSARRAVSLDIDSIAVSMAHLEPPSASHPIQVAADNGDASSVPIRKDPTSHVSKTGHTKKFVQDPSAASNSRVPFSEKAKEVHVTEAFMKCLLMFSSSRSVISHFTQDPCFREFLKRAVEHGVPSSLLAHDSDVMRNSVFNMKDEVYQNTLMLKESWKTTGYTLMMYHKKKSKDPMVLIGFYCPKGVVFLEAPHPEKDYDGFRECLEETFTQFLFNDQTNYFILHHGPVRLSEDSYNIPTEYNQCLRDEIEEICIDSCTESAWAQSLIKQAVGFHEKICSVRSLRQLYYKILEKDDKIFQDFENIKSMSPS